MDDTPLYPVIMASTYSHALDQRDAPTYRHRMASTVLQVLSCSAIVAIGAQLELKLPFTPVPITGQSLSVVIVGLLFGRNIAVSGVAAYLLEGASGLPVFSGGASGAHHLLGPTGGYLLGFLPAAFIAGAAKDRGITHSPLGIFLTVIASSIPIFGLGVVRLWSMFGDLSTALSSGLYPFIPGDFIKAILASMAAPFCSLMPPRKDHLH